MEKSIEGRFKNVAASKTFRHIVDTFQLGQKSVLDIGCSFGEFLVHFGPGSVGISINPEEMEYGKQHGLDIRLGNIESPAFHLAETFDAVFANNIFEHLYSPHAFLIHVKKYLKPNGVLVLGVPCIPKIVSLLHVRKFRGSLAEQHINFFTRDTLLKTVERAGWEVASVRGFVFFRPWIDHRFDFIFPHFYVVAKPKLNFSYSEKRMKELQGYTLPGGPDDGVQLIHKLKSSC